MVKRRKKKPRQHSRPLILEKTRLRKEKDDLSEKAIRRGLELYRKFADNFWKAALDAEMTECAGCNVSDIVRWESLAKWWVQLFPELEGKTPDDFAKVVISRFIELHLFKLDNPKVFKTVRAKAVAAQMKAELFEYGEISEEIYKDHDSYEDWLRTYDINRYSHLIDKPERHEGESDEDWRSREIHTQYSHFLDHQRQMEYYVHNDIFPLFENKTHYDLNIEYAMFTDRFYHKIIISD